jgi:hypothetical protein
MCLWDEISMNIRELQNGNGIEAQRIHAHLAGNK